MTPHHSNYPRYKKSTHPRSKPIRPSDIPTDGSAKITALRPCSDQPDHLSLRVNRTLMGRISITTKTQLNLQLNDAWTQSLADTLHTQLTRSRAYRSAARILSARAKSAHELRQSLRRKGNDPDAIEYAITRLTELGVLNDANYAELKTRSLLRAKPAGRRFLEAKLRTKGIDQSTINTTLDEQLQDRDPLDDAFSLAKRFDRSISQTLEPEVRTRRLVGRLARRGFDHDTIRKALDKLTSQEDHDEQY